MGLTETLSGKVNCCLSEDSALLKLFLCLFWFAFAPKHIRQKFSRVESVKVVGKVCQQRSGLLSPETKDWLSLDPNSQTSEKLNANPSHHNCLQISEFHFRKSSAA
jgi:hypothetical protein